MASHTSIKLNGPDALAPTPSTREPAGRRLEKSTPTPPPICMVSAASLTLSNMPVRSSGTVPMTKQLKRVTRRPVPAPARIRPAGNKLEPCQDVRGNDLPICRGRPSFPPSRQPPRLSRRCRTAFRPVQIPGAPQSGIFCAQISREICGPSTFMCANFISESPCSSVMGKFTLLFRSRQGKFLFCSLLDSRLDGPRSI